MANRRMLHRNVSTNEQLADCSLLARLLYTWGLPHTSDWGVLSASPRRLKAEILPLSDETADQIAAATDELIKVGLWTQFKDGDADYVCYPTFEKYQDVRHRTENARDGLPKPPTYRKQRKDAGTPRKKPEDTDTSSKLPEVPVNPRKLPEVPVNPRKLPEVPANDRVSSRRESGEENQENQRENAREEPAPDYAPMLLTNDPLLSAVKNYFCSGNLPVLSVPQAQDYTIACKKLLAVPNADLREADLLEAFAGGNGPLPGKECGKQFGPEAWIERLRREKKSGTGDARADPVLEAHVETHGPRPEEPVAGMIWDRKLQDAREGKSA